MECARARLLIHGYLDGELGLTEALSIEEHLESCTGCASELANHRALRQVLQAAPLTVRAPARLRARFTRRRSWTFPATALALALALFVFWPGEMSTDALLSSHLRSLQPGHLADIISTDQHTVKPWFSGKLDYAPPVEDFKSAGFPLAGGRLDYLGRRPVAALVYRRRAHIINLFVWPGTARERTRTQDGYHIVSFSQGGMIHEAVSDLNMPELEQFVTLVRSKENR